MIQILRRGLLLLLIALRQESDDFRDRQGFIEQLDRCRTTDGQRKNCSGKQHETTDWQDRELFRDARRAGTRRRAIHLHSLIGSRRWTTLRLEDGNALLFYRFSGR